MTHCTRNFLAGLAVAMSAACNSGGSPAEENGSAPLPTRAPAWTFEPIFRQPPDAATIAAEVQGLDPGTSMQIVCSGTFLTQLVFKTGREIPQTVEQSFRYSIDNGPPAQFNGWYADDTVGTEYDRESPIVRAIRGRRLLAVDIAAPGVEPYTIRFNIFGADRVMDRVRSECWVNDPSEAHAPYDRPSAPRE